MFQSLLRFRNDRKRYDPEEIRRRASEGDPSFGELSIFLDGIDRFAFFEELCRAAGGETRIREAASALDYAGILEGILSADGLGLADLPKGLLPFHKYPDGNRTPFEEHLVEAALYAKNAAGLCRLHFTVSPEHERRFRTLLEETRPAWESRFGVRYEVDFSAQKRSTDTLALDPSNRLVRDEDGSILLRPGGHGSLIENLSDLAGDVVLIKNIDNVSPKQMRPELVRFKKVLAGMLVMIQEEIFDYLGLLQRASASQDLVEEAGRFVRETFLPDLPARWEEGDDETRRAFLIDRLDRPIRVCGMVPNAGQAGGGPFWVEGKDGTVSIQIVEGAQIDKQSEEQVAILNGSTHFNPVDIACGLLDRHGKPFDLHRFIDRDAVFISMKSKAGKSLKALERPGLWNGAMAHWNTLFIEVPPDTFTPVKRVTDLLSPEHQAV